MNLTANKGEWSELYALFKIFSEHSVVAADKNLQPTDDKYTFLQVFREDIPSRKYIYDLQTDNVVKIYDQNGNAVKIVDISDLPEKTKGVFRKIKEADKPTFTINEAVDIMGDLLLEKIKASSGEKSDIVGIVKDKISEHSKLGFSIKSQIGGASTLLNASTNTNFAFRINNFSGYADQVNDTGGKSKIRDRLQQIFDAGGTLEFSYITSQTFTKNMRLVDTVLPQILANMLVDYYSGNGSSLQNLCEHIGAQNLFSLNAQDISYKVKSFLRAVALGMIPSKEWDTYLSTYGGYIVVRDDGLLLCYHLYNDDDFKDYLFDNTKFDTPSSTRHDFGMIYFVDGKPMINLNLQIRFNK
jgi:type II restriction enzyme